MFWDSEENVEIKSDGVVNTSLINEIHTAENDLEFYLKVLCIIEILILVVFVVKFIIKQTKKQSVRDQIMMRERAALP